MADSKEIHHKSAAELIFLFCTPFGTPIFKLLVLGMCENLELFQRFNMADPIW